MAKITKKKKYGDGGDIRTKKGTITQTYPAPDEASGGQMFQDPTHPYAGLAPDLAAKLMEMNMLKIPQTSQAPIDTVNPMEGKNLMLGKHPLAKMAGGGPITTQERNAWENMQSAAYQQGFQGNDHTKQPGVEFMKKYGVDPARLPAYQQDFQQLQGQNPIKGEGQTRATHGQYSGVDDIYGKYTSGQRYTQYQSDINGKVTNYGTDFNAFKTDSDALQAKQNKSWEGFGNDANLLKPNYSGFSGGAPAPQPAPQAPASGFPTREQAVAKYQARPQQDNWHTEGETNYDMHAGDEMGKGGWIKKAVNPAHKGYCTPITKSTCTGHRKTFALMMKKKHGFHKHGDGGVIRMADGNQVMAPALPQDGSMQIGQSNNPQAWQPAPGGYNPQQDKNNPVNDPENQPIMNADYSQNSIEKTQQPGTPPTTVGAGITLGTAGLIAGADALVNMKYNQQIHASENAKIRKNMMSNMSPNNFNGSEMLTYGAGGNIVDQFKTHPMGAKEYIEGGEYVELPNGQGDVAQGDKHYMASGGIPTDLPPQSRVYSDQDKPDTKFIKAVSDGKVTKKMTYADLVKRYDTEKQDDILNDPKADPIARRSAKIVMAFKDDKKDQIFKHQQMMKNPMEAVMEDLINNAQPMAHGGEAPCFGCGGSIKYMGPGGETGSDYVDFNYMWKNGLPQANGFDETQAAKYGKTTKGYQQYANANGANLKEDGRFGVNTMSWKVPKQDAPAPTETPTTAAQPAEDPYLNLVPYAPTKVVPQTEETNTEETSTDKSTINKPGFSFGQRAVPGWIPGAVAAINAISDYPIHSAKLQPDFLGKMEGMNIDPVLNRDLAIGRAGMTGNSGNASVDQARALQSLGSTQQSDEAAYAQKFNFDGQQEFQRRAKNVEIKNNADAYNLQRMDQTWDKMTARDAAKRQAFQTIANNAYTNSRKELYDKNSQELIGELFPNYDYKPGQGFNFVDDGTGTFHMVPLSTSTADTTSTKKTISKKTKSNGQSETKVTERET